MATQPTFGEKQRSGKVLGTAPAGSAEATEHFARKLGCETNPEDVRADLERGLDGFVVVDARSPGAYREGHVPGAVSLPHAEINESMAASLIGDRVTVTYCWGPACNAATKAGLKLAFLGVPVKELIGGWQYWTQEGHPIERA